MATTTITLTVQNTDAPTIEAALCASSVMPPNTPVSVANAKQALINFTVQQIGLYLEAQTVNQAAQAAAAAALATVQTNTNAIIIT